MQKVIDKNILLVQQFCKVVQLCDCSVLKTQCGVEICFHGSKVCQWVNKWAEHVRYVQPDISDG